MSDHADAVGTSSDGGIFDNVETVETRSVYRKSAPKVEADFEINERTSSFNGSPRFMKEIANKLATLMTVEEK